MKKLKITKKELILRLISILVVAFLAVFTRDSDKQVINVLCFLSAFLITVYYRRHFFPYMSGAIFCYLAASTQELWNTDYVYLPITKVLWTAGNILLPLGIFDFAYRLYFQYKIVDHDTEK